MCLVTLLRWAGTLLLRWPSSPVLLFEGGSRAWFGLLDLLAFSFFSWLIYYLRLFA